MMMMMMFLLFVINISYIALSMPYDPLSSNAHTLCIYFIVCLLFDLLFIPDTPLDSLLKVQLISQLPQPAGLIYILYMMM